MKQLLFIVFIVFAASAWGQNYDAISFPIESFWLTSEYEMKYDGVFTLDTRNKHVEMTGYYDFDCHYSNLERVNVSSGDGCINRAYLIYGIQYNGLPATAVVHQFIDLSSFPYLTEFSVELHISKRTWVYAYEAYLSGDY